MKYTKKLLLCILLILAFLTGINAQKVSLNFKHGHLTDVLNSITKQTGFTFAYSSPIVSLDKEITIVLKNTELSEALELLFSDTQIDYEIGEDKIYLTDNKKKIESKPVDKIWISGVIKDENDETLIGASVVEKGSINGTVSNQDGNYSLYVYPYATIEVSYMGYVSQEIPVSSRSMLNIILKEDTKTLNELVVTALGIKKKEKSLTYSVQQIEGVEFTKAKDINLINTLAGKTSNLLINRNSSGLGSSSRVIIRGSRSASKNNQPLYVLNGLPILNSNSEYAYSAIGGTANAGNRDGGDGISNLNPDDIENMTILKGASASALYGSEGANGVILITTKKGEKGIKRIHFNTGVTFDNAITLPKFQNTYSHIKNTTSNWGERNNSMPVYDNIRDFFSTGVSNFNSLILTTGTEKSQTYFSYSNTYATGIIDNNKLNRHNFNLRQTVGFFNNKLIIDPNINFITQNVTNKLVSGGYYMNPLVGLYTFPRGKNISEYKNNYEVYNANRNMYVQNWYTSVDDGFEQNPYWLKKRVKSEDNRIRTIASLQATLKINDFISLEGRGNIDYIRDHFKQKMYASTSSALTGENGRYIDFLYQDRLIYGDVMALINKNFGIIDINGAVGAMIKDINTELLRYDSGHASLYYPNVFTIANIRMNTDAFIDEQILRQQTQSVFASVQLGYKSMVYLDLTARNEWSSTLAFTNSMKSGFFYPSIGASWIINETFRMPEQVSLGKLRGSWSKVGNGLTPTVTYLMNHITAGGQIQDNHAGSYSDLNPEMSTSIEFGTEWRFFKQRINVDLTFYKTNTKNQLFSLTSTAGLSSVKDFNLNAGDIENKGIEFTVGASPVLTKDFSWHITLNYATNKNLVVKLHDDLTEYMYGMEGISNSYRMILREGGSFGDIYGRKFLRDENGNIIYSDDGLPNITGSDDFYKVGNCNPKYMIGWGNTFRYKNFSLYFLIDGQFGGKVLSQTQAEIDYRGVSQVTGDARDKGYVMLEGSRVTDVEGFFNLVGGRNGITEYYMYDATNIRLRELVIDYYLPEKLIQKINFITAVQISLTGRNLFFIYKKAPFDPDATLSTANDNQGIDVFGTPLTRSIGFNLRFTF